MSQSFRFEQMPQGVERTPRKPRHLARTRKARRTLERVQFFWTRVSGQVAVFHESNVWPQGRDYKR
jgi:hypothetical protein